MCIYTYIHTYIPTYIPTYLHTYIHTYIHMYHRLLDDQSTEVSTPVQDRPRNGGFTQFQWGKDEQPWLVFGRMDLTDRFD